MGWRVPGGKTSEALENGGSHVELKKMSKWWNFSSNHRLKEKKKTGKVRKGGGGRSLGAEKGKGKGYWNRSSGNLCSLPWRKLGNA